MFGDIQPILPRYQCILKSLLDTSAQHKILKFNSYKKIEKILLCDKIGLYQWVPKCAFRITNVIYVAQST